MTMSSDAVGGVHDQSCASTCWSCKSGLWAFQANASQACCRRCPAKLAMASASESNASCAAVEFCTFSQIFDTDEWPLPSRLHQPIGHASLKARNTPQTQTHLIESIAGQLCVPHAVHHINRQHRHAMTHGILYQLRWGVKPRG